MSEESSNSRERATPPSRTQSLDRAVAILNSFTPSHPELGVSEIARMTGLTRSTAHRIIKNLESHQLIQQVQPSRRYVLGPHLLRLAYSATLRINLQELARPVMVSLRDRTNETVGLSVIHGERFRIVVDQVESRHSIRRIYPDIGEPIPIHQGAPGRIMLAYLSDDTQRRILSGPLEASTEYTFDDPGLLEEELELVRDQGFAISIAERVEGVCTLAVPVFDHRGSPVAALSVTGPSTRVSREQLLEFAPQALSSAEELSQMLGFAEDNGKTPDR